MNPFEERDKRFSQQIDAIVGIFEKAQKKTRRIILASIIFWLSVIVGCVWLLLYILDTYVGKA